MKVTGHQRPRRKSRQALLQILYEIDSSGHSAEDSLRWVINQLPANTENTEFIEETIKGIQENQKILDIEIEKYAPNWPVDQLPLVDRNILRIAIYEVLLSQKVPRKVAVNEAVELAKRFGSESLPRFVNGVLGTLMETIPPEREKDTSVI